MQRFAQIDASGNVVQFVGFNTNANAVPHCQANTDCLFIPTTHFGTPGDYTYDSKAGEVVPASDAAN